MSEIVFFIIKFTKRIFGMPDGSCRFNPTCSQYSREALRELPFYKAIPKIIHRVSRCHPYGGFGDDPVIPQSSSNTKEKK